MKKIANLKMWLAMSVFLLGMAGAAAGQTIYVDGGASGGNDGTSWTDAFVNLQDALTAAAGGGIIWVAEGTYKPDQGALVTPGDRAATFQMENGVAIYGGFSSGGGQWEERDPSMYVTILSGDLNGDDGPDFANNGDNSRHVVIGSGTGDAAVLDGFTIMGGYADDWCGGGGMYNWDGSPTVTNCIFVGNSADNGGGMLNSNSSPTLTNCVFSANWTNGSGGGMHNKDGSSPSLTSCEFIGNWASKDGGGIYNQHACSPTLTHCTFSRNVVSRWGGGMYCWDGCNVTLTECTFSENVAGDSGGGLYVKTSNPKLVGCTFNANSSGRGGGGMCTGGAVNATLVDCMFSKNSADQGGALVIYDGNITLSNCMFSKNSADQGGALVIGDGNITLTNCIFSVNSAVLRGGGISNSGSPTLTNCTFTNNSAADDGGGISNDNLSSPILTNCTFSENLAGDAGGGMYNQGCWATVSDCDFIGNSAVNNGGGMDNHWCDPTVTNCTFAGNRAEVGDGDGGGMSNIWSSPTVTNCMFTANSAEGRGGGMYNLLHNVFYEYANITNCTFSGNSASYGGGMFNYNSSPTLTNCILWADTPEEVYMWGGTALITYSDVQGGWTGIGNINADPLFADADLRLWAGSPCIDVGDNTAVPIGITTDLDGNLRIVGAAVDMGAYELFAISVVIDIKPGSYPNAINLGSYGLIPVGILSSEDFDATTVDSDTVALGGAGVAVRGKSSKYMAHKEDVNGDGLVDLVVQIATENLDAGSFQDGYAVLTGKTYDGVSIEGSDQITIVPPEH